MTTRDERRLTETKIEDMHFSERLYKILKENNINTLSDIEKNKRTIKNYCGIGKKYLAELTNKTGIDFTERKIVKLKQDIKNETPINEIGLANKICDILLENGIKTVGDIKKFENIREIRTFKGIGKKALEEISEKIGINVNFFLNPESLMVDEIQDDTKIYNMGFSDKVYYLLKREGIETKRDIIEKYCEVRYCYEMTQTDLEEISEKTGVDLELAFTRMIKDVEVNTNTSILLLGLSNKVYNILKENNIKTVGDLRRKMEIIRHYRGIGPKTFSELQEKLIRIL